MTLYNQGNYTKARLEFKNVLQIDPKDANAYYMFGRIEEKDENWTKAYALYLRATELDPIHVDAQVHLGTIFALAGENEKALAAVDAAMNVKPDDPSAMVLKGFIRAKMGERMPPSMMSSLLSKLIRRMSRRLLYWHHSTRIRANWLEQSVLRRIHWRSIPTGQPLTSCLPVSTHRQISMMKLLGSSPT
ncbi:MAG: tetratricopeptide repeat protein [Candidatus Thiodiazotropha sp. (ex Cardiolucina cf. quadrata)]|nr:tetratricopeptide repeat protein [Candidatus Thiodiazotropha sp. (ex Cardiolucina cf. quadrata)]